MSRKKSIALCGVLGLGAVVVTALWRAPAADAESPGPYCRFEGTWGAGDPFGSVFYENLVSLDNANNRVSMMVQAVFSGDFGLFPEATIHTIAMGEARRTGPREFKYTFTWFGTDDDYNRIYRAVATGTKTLRPDCRTYDHVGTVEFFDANDAFFACIPTGGGPVVRLDDMEPCE